MTMGACLRFPGGRLLLPGLCCSTKWQIRFAIFSCEVQQKCLYRFLLGFVPSNGKNSIGNEKKKTAPGSANIDFRRNGSIRRGTLLACFSFYKGHTQQAGSFVAQPTTSIWPVRKLVLFLRRKQPRTFSFKTFPYIILTNLRVDKTSLGIMTHSVSPAELRLRNNHLVLFVQRDCFCQLRLLYCYYAI